jgi:hypothetical protein
MRGTGADDPAIEELTEARDREGLCRLLLLSAWGWGSSSRHEEAIGLLHGLLDACDSLDTEQRRLLVRRALGSGIARVRRAALDRLCELDGPKEAQRRARTDPDRTVRAWRPTDAPAPGQLELPDAAG